jgi:HAD superfamily hydrolase (TIGR01662 family)
MQDNSQPIKAVFFDLGYTLIYFSGDFYKVILESYLVLADELIKQGCQIDRIEFACEFSQKMQNYYQQREQDFLERPVGQIVTEILKEHHQELPSENALTLAMQAMYLITEKNWLLEEDTHETLQNLLDQNYQLGLISNASNAWDVNNLIDNHHLRNYFSTILISASEGIRKPNPKIFQIAADQMHVQLSNAVMVGDTLEADILGAHNAGMRGIWISRRKERPSPQETLDPRFLPDAEIHTLKELPALLSSWNK